MKTVYVPKGETVHYESLSTDHIVVKGCLNVTYGITAKTISGNGVIHAGSVKADSIRVDDLEAATVICKRLIAKRVEAPEVFASESAAVSCFLSAAYVETGKLTVAVSDIDEVRAQEVVNLPAKKRSLFGTLLSSAWRSFWSALVSPVGHAAVMDADYEPVDEVQETPVSAEENSAQEQDQVSAADEVSTQPLRAEPVDEELNRFISLFKLSRDAGYTLRIVPGTPEENAPIFDFEQECIIRPAA
ncbi:MAG: hypothetical protein RR475_12140 [Clostridia bacterium]